MIPNRRPNLIVLPGDGIGPEVIRQAVRMCEWFAKHRGFDCELRHEDFGAGAYHRTGTFLKDEVFADMQTADAILFGAIGGSIDANPIPLDIRRRFGLLAVRQALTDAPKAIRQQGEPEAETALRQPLEALAKRVLHPLLPHLGKCQRWFLSPDAVLWLVPWAALPLPDG